MPLYNPSSQCIVRSRVKNRLETRRIRRIRVERCRSPYKSIVVPCYRPRACLYSGASLESVETSTPCPSVHATMFIRPPVNPLQSLSSPLYPPPDSKRHYLIRSSTPPLPSTICELPARYTRKPYALLDSGFYSRHPRGVLSISIYKSFLRRLCIPLQTRKGWFRLGDKMSPKYHPSGSAPHRRLERAGTALNSSFVSSIVGWFSSPFRW